MSNEENCVHERRQNREKVEFMGETERKGGKIEILMEWRAES